MNSVLNNVFNFVHSRVFQILWILVVLYAFCDTFIYYKEAPQFYYLRNILGLGLYISRGTATVLNISCALVLVPLCKKLNRVLYRMLSQLLPGLFFFWLQKAKSFHMTVAITLVLFSVIHSISHFANLWNFSTHYNPEIKAVNFASYKNETVLMCVLWFRTKVKFVQSSLTFTYAVLQGYRNPLSLLLSQPGTTGVTMLVISALMAMTSLRVVRLRRYNVFWYTHRLYLPFVVLLMIHPLSGALKEEVTVEDPSHNSSQMSHDNITVITAPKFVAIKPKTWLWMSLPLSCFVVDLLWRLITRNRARVRILHVNHMPGRTMSVNLSCPNEEFQCKPGQYVLLQCLEVSLIEWHPFTVVKLPSESQRNFTLWIRVTGDWTETFERLLLENGPKTLSMLVDGPYSSPLQGVSRSHISICIAAGVGITPFVATLQSMLMNPRSRLPGRLHLIWIVKNECEISWLADLAQKTIVELRNSNKPDRLHLELYVTNSINNRDGKNGIANEVISHIVAFKGGLTHSFITKSGNSLSEDETITLLTAKPIKNPNDTRKQVFFDNNFYVTAKYPLLGCRIRKGRPCWDRLFEYWTFLYPKEQLSLYCCGPKKIVKILRSKTKYVSQTTSTNITFVYEGFS